MKLKISVVLLLCVASLLFTQETYQIVDVVYNITGITRIHALKNEVPIDTKTIFSSEDRLHSYIENVRVRLNNQRVFDSTDLQYEIGGSIEEQPIPVTLYIFSKDSWNIIALPYPKYDSNSGFQLKLKLKDYNFLGSMKVLNGDLVYEIDNDGKSIVSSGIDFSIPFSFFGYNSSIDTDIGITIPNGEIPKYTVSVGSEISIPLGFTDFNVGLEESIILNDRNSDGIIYEDNSCYFKNKVYANIPFTLYIFDYAGALTWGPYASTTTKWSFKGIQNEELKGTSFDWGHSLSLSRVDWIGNFRKGFNTNIENSYSWNTYSDDSISSSVSAIIKGYYPFGEFIGTNARLYSFYNFHNSISTNQGSKLRGILDKRIDTNTGMFFSFDMPIRILRADFLEITGVDWTRFVSFELHASPFIDFALTHDTITGKYFALDDSWLSGGLEMIVYPFKMRSIYVRASLGVDLRELRKNNFTLPKYANRDGVSTKEIFIGIGLEY